MIAAWLMLFVSVLGMICCSIQTAYRLISSGGAPSVIARDFTDSSYDDDDTVAINTYINAGGTSEDMTNHHHFF
jgi:hypothetical protein